MSATSKVIFLDIDGVLASYPFGPTKPIMGNSGRPELQYSLNADSVGRLNTLVERTGANIVLSSSWRKFWSSDAIAFFMKADGFRYPDTVIGATPVLDSLRDENGRYLRPAERGDEVLAYLAAHPEVSSFVVIDDDSDIGKLDANRWVYIHDGLNHGGLRDEHVELAVKILETPVASLAN